MEHKEWYTLREVAEIKGMGYWGLFRRIQRGKLPQAQKFGHTYLVKAADIATIQPPRKQSRAA